MKEKKGHLDYLGHVIWVMPFWKVELMPFFGDLCHLFQKHLNGTSVFFSAISPQY